MPYTKKENIKSIKKINKEAKKLGLGTNYIELNKEAKK